MNEHPPAPIFVGVGRIGTLEQERGIATILEAVRSAKLNPQMQTQEHWNDSNPVEPILAQLRECYGALVISFPRYRFLNGSEWPRSPNELAIPQREVPSVWLQIEAALACASGLPLLSLVERSTHPEGILNPRHSDFHALFYDLAACQDRLTEDVHSAIDNFANRVEAFKALRTAE